MPRAKFICAYCDKSFEDSQDARKRHFSGRNHRANVKLWYDSVADKDKQRTTAPPTGAPHSSQWISAAAQAAPVGVSPQPVTAWQQLPPSMIPAPPEAFRQRRRLAEWG